MVFPSLYPACVCVSHTFRPFLSGLFRHWYEELQGPTGQSPVCLERPSVTVTTLLTTAHLAASVPASLPSRCHKPDRLFPGLSALLPRVAHFGMESDIFNSADYVPLCLWPCLHWPHWVFLSHSTDEALKIQRSKNTCQEWSSCDLESIPRLMSGAWALTTLPTSPARHRKQPRLLFLWLLLKCLYSSCSPLPALTILADTELAKVK